MTPFLVKLDENLGEAHLRLLRESGYDADTVPDQRISGATDELWWSKVVADGRFLITLDLDFSDVRRFQPETHPGILLVRARSASRSAVLEVLRRVIAERPLEDLRGCLAVADERITRVRRPPVEPYGAR
jgi:predicted nuclease of predicted toxin-antitoxin system